MILRNFRKQIENIINESKLPIDCVYFVFKDIINELENIYSQEIVKEESLRRAETINQEESVDNINESKNSIIEEKNHNDSNN